MKEQHFFKAVKGVLNRVSAFGPQFKFLHMHSKVGAGSKFVTTSEESSLTINSFTPHTFSDGDLRGCFGNLEYLRQLINSETFVGSKSEGNFTVNDRNNFQLIRSINIRSGGRVEISYGATDPERPSVTQPARVDITEWPVTFTMGASSIAEINELKRLHAYAPSDEMEGIVQLSYADDRISLSLGGVSNFRSDVELDIDVVTSDKVDIAIDLLTENLARALKNFQNDDGCVDVCLADKAIKFTTKQSDITHELVMISRRQRGGSVLKEVLIDLGKKWGHVVPLSVLENISHIQITEDEHMTFSSIVDDENVEYKSRMIFTEREMTTEKSRLMGFHHGVVSLKEMKNILRNLAKQTGTKWDHLLDKGGILHGLGRIRRAWSDHHEHPYLRVVMQYDPLRGTVDIESDVNEDFIKIIPEWVETSLVEGRNNQEQILLFCHQVLGDMAEKIVGDDLETMDQNPLGFPIPPGDITKIAT